MKKILLFVFILFCYLSNGFCQTAILKNIQFGIKTGLNGSWFTSDADGYDGSANGFSRFFRISAFAGLTADHKISPLLTVGAELLYNARGMAYRRPNNDVVTITDQGTEQSYDYFKYDIDYIELPLTIKYNLAPINSPGVYVYGGAVPGYAINKMTRYAGYSSTNGSPIADNSNIDGELNDVNHFNLSAIGGLQFFTSNGPKNTFFVDLRTSYALIPVFDSRANYDTRMVTFSLGLGLRF